MVSVLILFVVFLVKELFCIKVVFLVFSPLIERTKQIRISRVEARRTYLFILSSTRVRIALTLLHAEGERAKGATHSFGEHTWRESCNSY